jgi:hypothetical protein
MTAAFLTHRLAQSRTCLWVSADPLFGEESVRYLELTPPVAIPAIREMRGHLEATTVRAFLVSSGFPSAGITVEAHHHCRKCGRVSLQSMADKADNMLSGKRASIHRFAFERSDVTSVSTNWFRMGSSSHFVHLALLYSSGNLWNMEGISR